MGKQDRFTDEFKRDAVARVAPERRVGWCPRVRQTTYQSASGNTEPYGALKARLGDPGTPPSYGTISVDLLFLQYGHRLQTLLL